MYHNKEVIDLVPSIQNIAPVDEQNLTNESPISDIRFGELGVGDKFVFDRCWLVKTGEYAAESDRKCGKQRYLFFKKDVVKSNKRTGDAGFCNRPYTPLLHANGSLQPTDFIKCKTEIVSDLRDELFSATAPFVEKQKPKCEIVIIPGADSHRVKVRDETGYRWETSFKGDLNKSWSIPLRLKNIELSLMYRSEEMRLYFEGKKIWSKEFYDWNGVHDCTIIIKDMRLESENA